MSHQGDYFHDSSRGSFQDLGGDLECEFGRDAGGDEGAYS